MTARKFKLALLQLLVGTNKETNVKNAVNRIGQAARDGAKIIVLPEVFNAPYGHDYFKPYSERIPGPSTIALQEAAKLNSVYLIGGSISEERDGKLFNTCTMINRQGELAGTFSKIHLFDIDVPGKFSFQESASLSAGSEPLIFETEYCNIGIGICYDIRFAELSRLYAKENCHLLVFPGAFNMTTGPVHWELITRSRALDNQLYVAACAPARDTSASYVAWGHSMVVDPWGTIVGSAEADDTTVYADIDMDHMKEVRQMIPLTNQRQDNIYDTISKKSIRKVK